MSATISVDLRCSVGVMAYNEEANIAQAIDSILRQDPAGERLTEIIVVASGCEDRTVEIVTSIAAREPRIRLIEQARREGKASAINLFIGAADAPVLALVSADVRVDDGAFRHAAAALRRPGRGEVGGRPIPVNGAGTFLGHAVHLQWQLHDRIARRSPKLGEMVAFRNVVPSIPLDTPVDELSIQALVTQLGYRLVYEPRAAVYNRGPATVADFLRQRRRIYAGHLRIRDQQSYVAPTMSTWRAGRALLGPEFFASPRTALWSLGTVGLEATARALGRYDVVRGDRSHVVWEMVNTTKQHIDETAWRSAPAHRRGVPHRELPAPRARARPARQPPARRARVTDRIQQALGSDITVSAQGAALPWPYCPETARPRSEPPARSCSFSRPLRSPATAVALRRRSPWPAASSPSTSRGRSTRPWCPRRRSSRWRQSSRSSKSNSAPQRR